MKDLKSIINEKSNFDKAKYLIGIYSNKKKEYDLSDKTGGDLNKEDDSDWFKEICEREKKIEKEREETDYPTYYLQL